MPQSTAYIRTLDTGHIAFSSVFKKLKLYHHKIQVTSPELRGKSVDVKVYAVRIYYIKINQTSKSEEKKISLNTHTHTEDLEQRQSIFSFCLTG